MQVVHPRCAGLDVHKRTIVVCILITLDNGNFEKHERTFGTMTPEILELLQWFQEMKITHAVMESAGVYWWPVYQLLESHLELLVVNAAHVKNLPGRKTDQSDAYWLADLLRHGLVRASFVPPRPQRELRELTRHRTSLTGRRAQAVNEMQRTLEGTNIKLASVATDITGLSATLMLEAMLAGHKDPRALAELARGKLRKKIPQLQQALQGVMREHQRLILSQLLADIELYEEQIQEVTAEIERRLADQQELINRLDKIPGVNRRIAEVLLAELGTDTKRFRTAKRAAAWTGICPGNNESGGKRRPARSRRGNRALKSTLVEAGMGAGRTKNSYLGAQFRRITTRRGYKRAAMAVGHSIFTIAFHIIDRGTEYQDLGADYFDRRNPAAVTRRLVKRLQTLGYEVTLTPAAVQTR